MTQWLQAGDTPGYDDWHGSIESGDGDNKKLSSDALTLDYCSRTSIRRSSIRKIGEIYSDDFMCEVLINTCWRQRSSLQKKKEMPKKNGPRGNRNRDLSHAKGALYH